MKKIITITLLLLSMQALNAARVVGLYTLSYFDREFTVSAASLKGNKYTVFIYVRGENSDKACININSGELKKFKESLLNMRDKYSEWSKTATENNVSKMTKLMDIKFPLVSIQWETPSKIYFSVRNTIDPVFSVLENGSHVAIIAKKAVSAMNRYIDETIYLVFSSADEIDGLLSILDEDKIISVVKEEDKLINLFN